jgi:serine/threonine protein phosphatase PrpC
MVSNFVRKRLKKGKSSQKVSEQLVKHAYNKGSKDNISAVVISFTKPIDPVIGPQNMDQTTQRTEQEHSDVILDSTSIKSSITLDATSIRSSN